MIVDDTDNWYTFGSYKDTGEPATHVWNHGAEIWCNIEG